MKKNITLEKIKKYSAVSGTILLSSIAANADIVYTDIDPDSLSMDNNVMEIDMDNDGNAEFFMVANDGLFGTGLYAYKWSPVGPYASSASIAKASQGTNYAYMGAYSASEKIDSNLDFFFPASAGDRAILGQVYSYVASSALFGTVGEFPNVGEKFVGVRFNISGNAHYGWIRVDLKITTDSTALTILDYAYEDVAGDSIMTGAGIPDPTAGISIKNSINANLYTSNGSLIINFEEVTNGNLSIVSLNGSVVYSDKVNTANYTTSVNNLSSGIYIVHVQTENGILTKKISL